LSERSGLVRRNSGGDPAECGNDVCLVLDLGSGILDYALHLRVRTFVPAHAASIQVPDVQKKISPAD